MTHSYDVVSSDVPWRGRVTHVRSDVVRMPGGATSQRDVVVHPGAVGVVALDGEGRVLLVRQYRHPVREALWELPAGLRDVHGEPPVETARRELLEEAGARAETWHLLAEAYSSPGFTDEHVFVYLARDVTEVPESERPALEHEELDMRTDRVPLDEAGRRVTSGEYRNAMLVIGVLAALRARDAGWAGLRAPG